MLCVTYEHMLQKNKQKIKCTNLYGMALKVKCYEQTNSRLMCLDKRNLDMVFVVDAVKQRHNNALTIGSGD